MTFLKSFDNDAVFVHTMTGDIIDVNRRACELMRCTRQQLVSMRVTDFHPEDERSDSYGALESTGETGSAHFESQFVRPDGSTVDVEVSASVIDADKGLVQGIARDITERKQAESERETTIELLALLNAKNDLHGLMRTILRFMQELSGCEAVGIRLRDGDDFPYYETSGFSDEFVEAERHLCVSDSDGQVQRDAIGNPVLACMCGNVICGRFDPSKPFFTDHGSFWSNCTTEMLAGTTEADRQSRTRNRCNGEGYESVALIPLRAGGETFGLMQFNDRRKGWFSHQFIALAERLADNVAIALAQRQAEEELREKDHIIRSASSAIASTDLAGKMTYMNPAFLKMWGFDDTAEVLGRPFPEFWMVEERQDEIMEALQSGEGRWSAEIQARRKDGTLFDVHVSAATVRDKQGRPISLMSTSVDITERKRAEEERVRLVTAIEQTADAIIVSDLDGTIQYVNPAFERISGYSREEAVGQTTDILRTGDHDESFYQGIRADIAKGNVWRGRLRRKKKDGTEFESEITVSPVTASSGEITNLVSVSRDVTREVELDERLRQAQKMEAIGTLAGGIAHDFNNILYAILGFNELALARVPDESPLRPLLTEVDVAARRGADLVEQILSFSRKGTQEHRPIQLQPVVKEALKLLRSSLPSTIEMRTAIEPGCGPVIADATEIHQIVMNLCTNAYHAMRKQGGLLEVRLEEVPAQDDTPAVAGLAPARFARLSVIDSGDGIDVDILERIFEPYFTTKERGEGTGLGLATVHGIVESCGGTITVESDPGQRTMLQVFLPICISEAPHGAEKTEAGADLRGHESLLIVDDEVPILDIQEMILERLGYKVTAFSSALEALQAFRKRPGAFDLVITDLTMPKLPGFELAKEMLETRPDLPVILCTGQNDMVNESDVKAAGIRGFLKKPIDTKHLASMVKEALLLSRQSGV